MATTSKGCIGQNLAPSFCERIGSNASITVTKGNSVFAPEEINILTVLGINREYIKYMRHNHPDVARQQFKRALVSLKENVINEKESKGTFDNH